MWKSGWFSGFNPKVFRIDCVTSATYYFNDMRRIKSGAIQVDVYKRDYVPTSVSCPSSSESSGAYYGDLYKLDDIYEFSAEITEETLKMMDVGYMSTSEITNPVKLDEAKDIFFKGLQAYGMTISEGGRRKKIFKMNRPASRKSERQRRHKYDLEL
jgi:hypothetical protein